MSSGISKSDLLVWLLQFAWSDLTAGESAQPGSSFRTSKVKLWAVAWLFLMNRNKYFYQDVILHGGRMTFFLLLISGAPNIYHKALLWWHCCQYIMCHFHQFELLRMIHTTGGNHTFFYDQKKEHPLWFVTMPRWWLSRFFLNCLVPKCHWMASLPTAGWFWTVLNGSILYSI